MSKLNRSIPLTLIILSITFFSLLLQAKEAGQELPSLVKNLNAPLPANLFVELAKLINPAVVNIQTKQERQWPGRESRKDGYRDPLLDMLEQFMGPQSLPPQESLGTGFVISEDGLIITNAHVIEGATSIKIQFSDDDKKFFEAELKGRDVRTDIALLKIEGKKKFPTLKLGHSRDVQVGDWVAAFGNPLGLGHTVTKGIISAKGREINELNRFPFLQTDASINPGNSGGPLVDSKGYVIGVNTAIARGQGIGFAIPIDKVKTIVEKLQTDGQVVRGFIGIGFQEINEAAANYYGLKESKGLLISSVMEDGPAEEANLKPGDVIISFAGKEVNSGQDLINAVGDSDIGSKQEILVVRNGKNLKKKIEIVKHPDDDKDTAERYDAQPGRTYEGQKAPFDLGFYVDRVTPRNQQRFGLRRKAKFPVVIKVEMNSPAENAGLLPGDLIVEVNKASVKEPNDVLKKLKNGANALRIRRQGNERFIFMQPASE